MSEPLRNNSPAQTELPRELKNVGTFERGNCTPPRNFNQPSWKVRDNEIPIRGTSVSSYGSTRSSGIYIETSTKSPAQSFKSASPHIRAAGTTIFRDVDEQQHEMHSSLHPSNLAGIPTENVLQDVNNSRQLESSPYYAIASHLSSSVTNGSRLRQSEVLNGRVHKKLKKPSASEVQREALMFRSNRLEKDSDLKIKEKKELEKTISRSKQELQGYGSSLREKMQELQAQLMDTGREKNEFLRREQELMNANSQSDTEVSELRSKLDESNNALASQQQFSISATDELRSLRDQMERKVLEFNQTSDKVKKLQKSLEESNLRLSTLDEEKRTSDRSNSSLSEELTSLKNSCNVVAEEFSQVLEEKATLAQMLNRSNQDIAEKEQALNNYREKLDLAKTQSQKSEKDTQSNQSQFSEQLTDQQKQYEVALKNLQENFAARYDSMCDQLAQERAAHGITAQSLNNSKLKSNEANDRNIVLTHEKECLLMTADANSAQYKQHLNEISCALSDAQETLRQTSSEVDLSKTQVAQLSDQKQKLALETYELAKCLDIEISRRKNREGRLAAAEEELNQRTKELGEKNLALKEKNDVHEKCRTELQSHILELQETLEQRNVELSAQRESNANLLKEKQEDDTISNLVDQLNKANDLLFQERKTTRRLQNQIQEMKSSIRLVARVRPQHNYKPDPLMNLSLTPSEIVLSEKTCGADGKERSRQLQVQFDRVFGPDATNETVCEETEYSIQGALDGRHASILAYGQTGSGKTWTMGGKDGIMAYALRKIVETRNNHALGPFEISVEAIEIYNESIRDMFSPDDGRSLQTRQSRQTTSIQSKISSKMDAETKHPVLVGTKTFIVTNEAQGLALLEAALKNRSTSSTAANNRSSRSHFVFSIHIKGSSQLPKTGVWSAGNNKGLASALHGVLHLVDSAGSERVNHSQVTGVQLTETKAINQSLSASGIVISASQNTIQGAHIPYRSSKLTYLLQSALSGDAKTMLLTTLAPEQSSLEETKSSLRFAEKTGKAVLKKA